MNEPTNDSQGFSFGVREAFAAFLHEMYANTWDERPPALMLAAMREGFENFLQKNFDMKAWLEENREALIDTIAKQAATKNHGDPFRPRTERKKDHRQMTYRQNNRQRYKTR